MLERFLATAAVAFASALLPFVNIEAYLALAVQKLGHPPLLAAAAALGQMAGKVLWYYAGRESGRLPFIRRRLDKPTAKARLELWQSRTRGRPWWTVCILFLSAFAGFPPYAIIAGVAGALRVDIWIFVVSGTIGRFLRFWLILVGALEVIKLF